MTPRAHGLVDLANAETRETRLHQKDAELFVVLAGVGARDHRDEARLRTAADVALDAVQIVPVPLLARVGPDSADIGTGFVFGDGTGRFDLPGRHPRQVALLLALRPQFDEPLRADPGMGRDRAGKPETAASDHLMDKGARKPAETAPAIGFRNAHPEQTQGPRLG